MVKLRRVFHRFLTGAPKAAAVGRERLNAEAWPDVVYAIGDVHGCYDELTTLEAMILADAQSQAGEKWIIMLGDYTDRGPNSAAVLDKLCSRPPEGFRRFCLAGNHESMLLDFVANPQSSAVWLQFGGRETLASYGIDVERFLHVSKRRRVQILEGHIPSEHLDFLRGLPVCLSLPGAIFVHAGLRPGVPPERQADTDMQWIREPFLSSNSSEFGLVIHGHTPTPEPEVKTNRIGIDTAAFATSKLTAVRLSEHAQPAYLSTG